VVFGIEVNGTYKAYREEDLIQKGKIEDRVGGNTVVLERSSSGIVTVRNKETGEKIVKERDYWFVWYAFYPETELYEG
jgi:hypothetical protein